MTSNCSYRLPITLAIQQAQSQLDGFHPNPIGASVDKPLTLTHSAVYDTNLDSLVLRDSHGSAQLRGNRRTQVLVWTLFEGARDILLFEGNRAVHNFNQ